MRSHSGHPMARSARGALGLAALLALAAPGCDRRPGATPELKVTTAPAATPAAGAAPAAPVPASGRPAPRVVAFDPPNGALDVDPKRASLSVTFDRAMDPEGWAWVIERPESAPTLGESSFDPTRTVNTVVATLEPGRTYVVWVNSPQFAYFKGADGTPATPVRWTFTTRGAPAAAASAAPALLSARSAGGPRIVALDPPNGATAVDPALPRLRATFDQPMEESWSWVRESVTSFPATTGAAAFESDGRTAYLPVRLEPGRTYVVWLNSEEFQLFRDHAGRPAPPLRWSFTTAPAR